MEAITACLTACGLSSTAITGGYIDPKDAGTAGCHCLLPRHWVRPRSVDSVTRRMQTHTSSFPAADRAPLVSYQIRLLGDRGTPVYVPASLAGGRTFASVELATCWLRVATTECRRDRRITVPHLTAEQMRPSDRNVFGSYVEHKSCWKRASSLWNHSVPRLVWLFFFTAEFK